MSFWYVDPTLGNAANDGKGPLKIAFTSGGIFEIVVGATITGAISGAQGTVMRVDITSGSWAAGTAAGNLYLWYDQTGIFQSENLKVGSNLDVATISGNSANATFSKPEDAVSGKGATNGDHILTIKSPDPYATGVNVTVANGNKNFTLSSALTKVISDCQSAWVPVGSGVTFANPTNAFIKSGTKAASIEFPTAFTTGKFAYYDFGSNQNFSAYTNLTLQMANIGWVMAAGGQITINLCSDATGDVPVDSFVIPVGSLLAVMGACHAVFTVAKTGRGTLGVAIRSFSVVVDVKWHSQNNATLQFNFINACNAVSFESLLMVGAPRTTWSPLTPKNIGDTVVCTWSSDSWLYFTCSHAGTTGSIEPSVWPVVKRETVLDGDCVWTCTDVREGWRPIQQLNGTAGAFDVSQNTVPSTAISGYDGLPNGTYPLYARETIKIASPGSGAAAVWNNPTAIVGLSKATIGRVKGGYDFTNGIQNGQTWLDIRNSLGVGIVESATACRFTSYENLAWTRVSNAIQAHLLAYGNEYKLIDSCGLSNQAIAYTSLQGLSRDQIMSGIRGVNNNSGISCYPGNASSCAKGIFSISCGAATTSFGVNPACPSTAIDRGVIKGVYLYRCGYGITLSTVATFVRDAFLRNNVTADLNPSPAYQSAMHSLENCEFASTTEFGAFNDSRYEFLLFSKNHDRILNNHRMFARSANATYQTSVFEAPAAGSWKVNITNAERTSNVPFRISGLLMVTCRANIATTISVRFRRDHTNIVGKLVIPPYAIDGVTTELVSANTSAVNVWETLSITFTPTVDGFCPFQVHVWDGVTTDKNLYFCNYSQTH